MVGKEYFIPEYFALRSIFFAASETLGQPTTLNHIYKDIAFGKHLALYLKGDSTLTGEVYSKYKVYLEDLLKLKKFGINCVRK